MIALWIFLGLLGLILLFLVSDLAVSFTWDQTWYLWARVFFVIPINVKRIIVKPGKKKKEKPKKEKEAPKEEKPEKEKEKRTLSELISFIKAICRAVREAALGLKKHLRIRLNRFELVVSCPDAADTALWYGRANAALYSLLGLSESGCKVTHDEKRVWIKSDFTPGAFSCAAKITIKIKPIFLISTGLKALFAFWRDVRA